jgi:hypothetical protein
LRVRALVLLSDAIALQFVAHGNSCQRRLVRPCVSDWQCHACLQGQHKISRGYLPSATYSSHFVLNTTAAHSIRRYLQSSALETEAQIEALKAHASPFKENDADLEGVLTRLMSRAAQQAR